MKNLTINQAAKKLETKGHKLTGLAQYDLANKTACYKVTLANGDEVVLNSTEIKNLIK